MWHVLASRAACVLAPGMCCLANRCASLHEARAGFEDGVHACMWYVRIGRELVPDDDQGEFNVGVSLPKGTSLQRTVEYTKEIEDLIRTLPEVQTVFTNLSPNYASYFVTMTPLETRKISQQDLIRRARAMLLSRYLGSGVRMSVQGGTDLSGASTAGTCTAAAVQGEIVSLCTFRDRTSTNSSST